MGNRFEILLEDIQGKVNIILEGRKTTDEKVDRLDKKIDKLDEKMTIRQDKIEEKVDLVHQKVFGH